MQDPGSLRGLVMRRRHFTLIGLAGVAQVVLDARQGVVGSPVDTWTGAAGTSVNATATGTQRPTVGTLNGQPALVFDGAGDIMTMSAGALGVFRNASQGRIFAVAQTLSASPANQNACYFSVGTSTVVRIGAPVVVLGSQTHRSAARRLDSDSFSPSGNIGDTSAPCVVDTFVNWAGNTHRGCCNGLESTANTFSSGGGNTSDTDSQVAYVGGVPVQEMHGPIAAVIATNQDWSAALAARVRHCLAFTFMIPQAA
jgi:hypothetical protein